MSDIPKITPSMTVGELRAALADVPQDAPLAILHENKVSVSLSVEPLHRKVMWVADGTVFLRGSSF